jgi:hypothetical protein
MELLFESASFKVPMKIITFVENNNCFEKF